MQPSIFFSLVYTFWLTLGAYLAVAAIGMGRMPDRISGSG
jgi:hypothetical protein